MLAGQTKNKYFEYMYYTTRSISWGAMYPFSLSMRIQRTASRRPFQAISAFNGSAPSFGDQEEKKPLALLYFYYRALVAQLTHDTISPAPAFSPVYSSDARARSYTHMRSQSSLRGSTTYEHYVLYGQP